MKTATEVVVKGTALVHNDAQGKDYPEDVEITLRLNVPSQTWFVASVVEVDTQESLWP